jgi:molybdopterin-dependent oxidoreductase alpha subunit
VPFGLGQTKPHHFRDMLRIAWENRDNWRYGWKVLTRGVCDGCALGTSGLRDWTVEGTHLCMVRLELLRLNTMGALDPASLADVQRLRAKSSRELRELGRLPYPMRRRRGEKGFTRVAWNEVWADVGPRWRAFSPDRTAMYVTSRGITNEVYYVAQKVMRYLGSNNVDNSARLCHSPSTSGLKSTIGVGATTCSYKDWYEADLVVFFGSNPANDQPVTTKYLAEARKRGVRVLSVNAYREPGLERYWVPSNLESALFGTRICDRTFLVRIGSDLAFLNAAAKLVLERGAAKREFIDAATTGFAEWKRALDAQSMDGLLAACGLALDDVDAFASEIASVDRAVFVWSMGITQHAHGGDTVRAIVNLGLLREFVGRAGTGMMPIRGHSGVQGGAEMGAYSTSFPGGSSIDESSARRFGELWGFEVPSRPGLPTVDYLEAAERGEIDAFYCIGGNFLETMPDPARIERALERIPLRVHSDIVVTTQMLVEPGETVYLLPARTRYEQRGGGTETSTERRVIFSPEIDGHRVGDAQSEWETLLQFARAVKPQGYERVHFESGAEIRADIERAVPSYAGISALAKQGDQFQWGGPMLCANRKFPTSDGKARFQPVAPPQDESDELARSPASKSDERARPSAAKSDELARPSARASHDPARSARNAERDGKFLIATRRGKQFNSMVQRGRDPLTGAERDHIFISPADAKRLSVKTNDRVLLKSATGEFRGRVFVADVAAGTLQGHWPEINVLIPAGRVDPYGGVPDYNAVVDLEIV